MRRRRFSTHAVATTLLFTTTTTTLALTILSTSPLSPPLPPFNTTTTTPSLTVWPTLPWWTKLRNPRLPPSLISYLDIYALSPPPPPTPAQATLLQDAILLPLALSIYSGPGPYANETVAREVGGVGAVWVPEEGVLVGREVVATAVAALASAEVGFGVRGCKGWVRVGEGRVGGLVVWVGGGGGEVGSE